MTSRPSDNDMSLVDPGQLQPDDTLVDTDLTDILDRGYSPPDYAPHGYGNEAEREGDGLDRHLAAEVPDVDPYAETDDDWVDENALEEDIGDDLERPRAGRLVQPDEGSSLDVDSQEVARDVGIDGAGASAEEAAMHICPPPEPNI